MVSQVTSMPAMSPGAVQSVLLTPYQVNNKHEPLVDYPRQHIKHAHLQFDYGTYQDN